MEINMIKNIKPNRLMPIGLVGIALNAVRAIINPITAMTDNVLNRLFGFIIYYDKYVF